MTAPQQQTPEVTSLQRYDHEGAEMSLMPALSIEKAVERYQQLKAFVSQMLVKDRDFGAIPGTDKQTLFKPGAEKLTTFFGLTKLFEIAEKVEDWNGDDHGGQPFFYYLYRCRLLRGDVLIAESDGSCNSRETKYRWREAKRTCPSCGQAAIIKGKEDFGGGWLCWKKQGGCGAKFADGAQQIESQPAGRVENPDVSDLVNTIQKMAQKRALIGATLLAVNASEFFTQDVEDFDPHVINVTPNRAAAAQPQAAPNGGQRSPAQAPAKEANGTNGRPLLVRIGNLRDKLLHELHVEQAALDALLGPYGCTLPEELTDEQARDYIADLSRLINETMDAGRQGGDDEAF